MSHAESPSARLVLASASPRRRELLGQMGYDFDIVVPETDETPAADETAGHLVDRLARAKALAACHLLAPRSRVILAADTVVALDDEILGKPTSPESAAAMLRQLSGHVHRVTSGVAVAAGGTTRLVTVTTSVEIRPLSDDEIAWYVATGEPLDKAGGYGIQGIGGSLVARIDGSHSNVVGLPLAETVALLDAAGIDRPKPPIPFGR